MTHPGNSTDNGGITAIVSLPAPPWETPKSRDEAMREAREAGAKIHGERNV